jgi:hypothetical protein
MACEWRYGMKRPLDNIMPYFIQEVIDPHFLVVGDGKLEVLQERDQVLVQLRSPTSA